MPRGWEDDSWYDEGNFPPISSERSHGGLVVAAVVSFVMAAFNALISCCFLICGSLFAVVGHANRLEGGFIPQDMVDYMAFGGLVFGLLCAVSFVMQIVAGLALLRSRSWARPLTFYLAGYALLVALGLSSLVVNNLLKETWNDDDVGFAVIGIVAVVFHLAYGLTEILVLLNPRVSRCLR